jgi:hypothetical protein
LVLQQRWHGPVLTIEPRRQQGAKILEAGRASGELRQDFDVTLILDQIYGAIYIRSLVRHAPLAQVSAQELVRNVLLGIRAPLTGKASSRRKLSGSRPPQKATAPRSA